MFMRFAFALSLLAAAPAAAQTAPAAPAPAEDLVKVALDTSAGRIVLALDQGRALVRFARMVAAQGGDPDYVEHPDRLPRAARCGSS